ncbi:hypothetical protein IE53DRAFT_13667 [Violaceomyces palustris]|uniref:Uncharacterized protein n=1 Tax=Violaceomyces palustris TaxID=1673888 RepID=A0ACD0P2E9_9BASI|nr:hypothetical protein IE53DRAFT_13667 [Violaceomyces palustris]
MVVLYPNPHPRSFSFFFLLCRTSGVHLSPPLPSPEMKPPSASCPKGLLPSERFLGSDPDSPESPNLGHHTHAEDGGGGGCDGDFRRIGRGTGWGHFTASSNRFRSEKGYEVAGG